MDKKIEFTDRYSALGIEPPTPETCCAGDCEGIGRVPVFMKKDLDLKVFCADETDKAFIDLWNEAEKANPTDDGWHFVKCPDCEGTGKLSEEITGGD